MHTPKSLKLLACKVKTKQNIVEVHAIRNKHGERQTLIVDILQVFSEYYTSLYSTSRLEPAVIKDLFDKHVPHLRLTDDHAEMLDEPVTPEGVQGVIKLLKTNKSPGLDGFRLEFYKAIAPKLTSQLALTFNEVLTCGTFPPSWNEASIVVFPKKDRDTLDTKCHRPISLLHQDYKIFMTFLTKRLNRMIGSYIHSDQARFIPNRDMLDNVYRTLEILHYCRANKVEPTVILSLDIEKAFDRLEHSYILTLLAHINFGPRFHTALQMAYQHLRALVRINGMSSLCLDISRGTRQGCPLLPWLFALAIEPLAEALRRSDDYRGIQIGKQTHKLSLFADDLGLYVQNPRVLLKGIESTLEVFQKVSGLSINTDKSLLYPVSVGQTEKDYLQQNLAYNWVLDKWKYLGVHFPLDFKTFSKANLESGNQTVNLTLRTWSDNQLSWFERIQIVKAMILPKYLFLFWVAALDITPQLLNKWQRSLLNFVWSYKKS